MDSYTPLNAIASASAIESYAIALKNYNHGVYLYFHLILYTGMLQKKALALTVNDIKTEIDANKPYSAIFNCNIPKEILTDFENECSNRNPSEFFFLNNGNIPLNRNHIRRAFEYVNRVNKHYVLNSTTLRKTYYWNQFIISNDKIRFLGKLHLLSIEEAAVFFGVAPECIKNLDASAKNMILYSPKTEETLLHTISMCQQILSEYRNQDKTEQYYQTLQVTINALEAITKNNHFTD